MQIENLPSSKVNIDFSSILSPKYMLAIWICPVAKFNKYSKKLKNQNFQGEKAFSDLRCKNDFDQNHRMHRYLSLLFRQSKLVWFHINYISTMVRSISTWFDINYHCQCIQISTIMVNLCYFNFNYCLCIYVEQQSFGAAVRVC